MIMKWEKFRNQFPVTKNYIYMNTGWCGPRSLRVQKKIDEIFKIECEQGVANPELLKIREDIRNNTRKKIAQLLNACEEEIALTDNTSNGINIIAASIDWKKGDEVIISDEEHPAGVVPWFHLRNLYGIKVKVAKIGNNENDFLTRLEESITEKTRLICLSHVSCMTGFRLPVDKISRAMKGTKALFLVDGAQSAGQIEIDVKKLECDIYSVPGQKWLMGPEGTGALYVRKNLIDKLSCINAGYRSVKTFNFEKEEMALHDSAKRFEMADKNTALLAGFGEAMDSLSEIGIEKIEERIKKLSFKLISSLKRIPGAVILSPFDGGICHSGLVSITVSDKLSSEIVNRLCSEKKIICRSFPSKNIMRFSVNFFNTEEEIETVSMAVKEI
ncbi:MAG: hypothetical protein A3C43_03050 [Candidatus Schekmanbacteria bacterium RIFCSPHIGHO2_02_FULL_38_11]|uniref:Aminotransferase class V domain-containing protein n=1 Tax=Candidatus Schekmanbacteria bacterium RIFCSPLOWO2_12_FULL_38_15 TaxID=1817883 RepID=A0A1F7SEE3_9BACT|nr:MAG: hypothetical protein A2043_01955 [Candidatus Schekmanbacteria bacterium GWA2_38_9]OGL49487.1 MAG: hypothetical protein A3H37_10305 [Candidatus Schekmanbacteria bacterium RIFCSPLOWO2_02_FULL_38_14]OGL52149.1 MAG: hypothetical protein A3G31_06945 [Candidatus Schekmanbacteria bacterium RIFCSPLOWO2_12_FULL_38_15]OGL53595.1 MAG: hypothetical protein A3C43_03050 [Candidatus Schekmanbacteria bacterium RIFCSPHIGHO2_02_FULL_38_11]